MTKTLVEMPLDCHRQLMSKCSECEILTNGILLPASRNDHSQTVVIFCDPEQLEMIINLASQICPEALPSIKQYTAPLSD
jgi:hypothetical protein